MCGRLGTSVPIGREKKVAGEGWRVAGDGKSHHPPPVTRHPIAYAAVRDEIRDADLLLFRRRNWYTRLIEVAGRSEYVHAAMAGWWQDQLMCVEMTIGGGRAQLLSSLVNEWPGVIDVYSVLPRLLPRLFRRKAVAAMIGITGQRYGWLNLWRTALIHAPIVRFLLHPDREQDQILNPKSAMPVTSHPSPAPPHPPSSAPYCSQAVSTAMRAGGVDPTPNLADHLTEPGDLARSAVLAYHCTLI